MAASLLALLDDITLLADDVSVMSKVAAKKTVGVLGDDIALNANQVSGFSPSRELPVVLAVAKGSAINKAILVPIALLLVVFAPWSLTPLLMAGGAFLCYEGVEKVFHKLLHDSAEEEAHHQELKETVQKSPQEILECEREKIKGAIRTDFILSAEIIAISLSTMQGVSLSQQAMVLVAISIIFTVGVYAIVAGVVKLDDLGIYLASAKSRAKQSFGRFILFATPYLMKGLSFLGTAALFLVGGGIITHGVPAAHHMIESVEHRVHELPGIGSLLANIIPAFGNMVAGFIVGTIVLVLVTMYTKIFRKSAAVEH
jgi:predicted DNA repair protein MutK